VKAKPKTQAFNNTSAILGIVFNGARLLFTGDAGCDALDVIPPEWKNLTWMQVPHHGSEGNLSQKNIERFCPQNAYISACGDGSHPDQAIVNGIMKVRKDAKVFSTHSCKPGHLRFSMGEVSPLPQGYGPGVPLKATGGLERIDWMAVMAKMK
jgi:beta-lactamase superfamily II metal-dependent hydrolase